MNREIRRLSLISITRQQGDRFEPEYRLIKKGSKCLLQAVTKEVVNEKGRGWEKDGDKVSKKAQLLKPKQINKTACILLGYFDTSIFKKKKIRSLISKVFVFNNYIIR